MQAKKWNLTVNGYIYCIIVVILALDLHGQTLLEEKAYRDALCEKLPEVSPMSTRRGTHAGEICEELQPVGRVHVGEAHGGTPQDQGRV